MAIGMIAHRITMLASALLRNELLTISALARDNFVVFIIYQYLGRSFDKLAWLLNCQSVTMKNQINQAKFLSPLAHLDCESCLYSFIFAHSLMKCFNRYTLERMT